MAFHFVEAFPVVGSYLRGRAFPGTVRLRRSQDQDGEKNNHSNAPKRPMRQIQRSRTGSETEFSNLPMNFREQVLNRFATSCLIPSSIFQTKEEVERGEMPLEMATNPVQDGEKPTQNRSSSAVRIAKFQKILESDMVRQRTTTGRKGQTCTR